MYKDTHLSQQILKPLPHIPVYPVFDLDDLLPGQESVFGRIAYREQAKKFIAFGGMDDALLRLCHGTLCPSDFLGRHSRRIKKKEKGMPPGKYRKAHTHDTSPDKGKELDSKKRKYQ